MFRENKFIGGKVCQIVLCVSQSTLMKIAAYLFAQNVVTNDLKAKMWKRD